MKEHNIGDNGIYGRWEGNGDDLVLSKELKKKKNRTDQNASRREDRVFVDFKKKC